ncbi:hypothetical protein ACCO45_012987 [Purpureocillium lilacinum]|uniref:Uncharacterized protein n=1 Tax=Purpureocillium lilacinum TaxID=33203 RepID=A0ACC4D9Q2_PURLI
MRSFRWVDCQFGALESCLTLAQLKQTLSSLPSTLSETYERVLASVPEHHVEHARRILHIVCFASEEVEVHELVHLAAVDIGTDSAIYDPEDQVHAELFRSVCPGFLDGVGQESTAVPLRQEQGPRHDGLHLLSTLLVRPATQRGGGRAKEHPGAEEASVEVGITEPKPEGQSELVPEPDLEAVWNLELDMDPMLDTDEAARRSFIYREVAGWLKHYRSIADEVERQLPEQMILRLFRNQAAFSRYEACLGPLPSDHPPRCWHGLQIYTAASLGLDFVIASMLDDTSWWKGSEPLREKDMVNHEWRSDTLLHVAARNGHATTVQLLLDRGVEVDVCRGVDVCLLSGSVCPWFLETTPIEGPVVVGTALLEAAWGGHSDIVAIDRNTDGLHVFHSRVANINNQGAIQGTALQAAAYERKETVVRLLLSRGADTNIQAGQSGTALQAAASNIPSSETVAAAWRGTTDVARLLLDRGADVNAQGGLLGTALIAATSRGTTDIIRLLLDRGADVNAQVGPYGTALVAGTAQNSADIVHVLLEHGADARVRTETYGTAFELAYGNDLLLDTLDVLFHHGLVPGSKKAKVKRELRRWVWPQLPRPHVAVEDTELLIGQSWLSSYEEEY